MKIAIITDQHFGVRNDSMVFHAYLEKFYSQTFFPFLKSNNIKTVICGGDLFDKRKQINFVSLEQSKRYFFDPLSANNIQFHCLVGNHDAPYKNSIKTSSSGLLLSEYPNINVIDTPQELELGNKKFLMLPWLCDENLSASISMMQSTDASILIGHLELAGFEMHCGQRCEHGQIDVELLGKFERVWSGHFHHRSDHGNILYLGNPYELTWADYNDPRGFHVYDTDSNTLEFIKNPFSMFHKIFYDDTNQTEQWLDSIDWSLYQNCIVKLIVVRKSDQLLFDTFVHRLQDSNPFEYKVIEDLSEFEDAALTDTENVEIADTVSLMNLCIDGVDTQVNKDRLKSLMFELYNEAYSSED